MTKKAILGAVSFALLAAQAAVADRLKLRAGGQLRGTLEEVVFRGDGGRVAYPRGAIVSIRLGSRDRAEDHLVLADGGRRVKGELISARFKTIAGILPYPRSRIVSIDLAPGDDVPAPATRPATQPAVRYDDRMKLSCAGEVAVTLVTATVHVGGKEVLYLRGKLSSIELRDNGFDVIVPAGGKRVEGSLVSVRVRVGSAVATFEREEVISIKLGVRPRERPARSTALTAGQKVFLAANTTLHRAYLRKVAAVRANRIGTINETSLKPVGKLQRQIRRYKGQIAAAESEAARLKQQWDDRWKQREKSSGEAEGADALLRLREARAKEKYDAAVERGKEAETKLAAARERKEQLTAWQRAEAAAIDAWALEQARRLKLLLARHRLLILAGAALGEKKMAERYEAAFGRSAPPSGHPPRAGRNGATSRPTGTLFP